MLFVTQIDTLVEAKRSTMIAERAKRAREHKQRKKNTMKGKQGGACGLNSLIPILYKKKLYICG